MFCGAGDNLNVIGWLALKVHGKSCSEMATGKELGTEQCMRQRSLS